MKVKRNIAKLKKLNAKEGSFSSAQPKDLVGFMWELTKELWSLKERGHAKRRLQRNITRLIRQ